MFFEPIIDDFHSEEYRFLSNFFDVYDRFWFAGRCWDTSEHAYQAMKTQDEEWIDKVLNETTPGRAKRLTYTPDFPLRSDWDKIKREVMYKVVLAKFAQNPELMAKLKCTGNAVLIERNTHHDNIWGDCTCGGLKCEGIEGTNWLGIILMNVRRVEVVE